MVKENSVIVYNAKINYDSIYHKTAEILHLLNNKRDFNGLEEKYC